MDNIPFSQEEYRFMDEQAILIEKAFNSRKDFNEMYETFLNYHMTGLQEARIKLLISYFSNCTYYIVHKTTVSFIKARSVPNVSLFAWEKDKSMEIEMKEKLKIPDKIIAEISGRVEYEGATI